MQLHDDLSQCLLVALAVRVVIAVAVRAGDVVTRLACALAVLNRTQAVRLPAESRFPEGVKRVTVRTLGKERILSPVGNTWDSFFFSREGMTDDFLPERASQEQDERESF